MNILELIKQRDDLNKQIRAYNDGFEYFIFERSYNNTEVCRVLNEHRALEIFKKYNGDDGYCYVYTNNPKYVDSYPCDQGQIDYIESLEHIEREDHRMKLMQMVFILAKDDVNYKTALL